MPLSLFTHLCKSQECIDVFGLCMDSAQSPAWDSISIILSALAALLLPLPYHIGVTSPADLPLFPSSSLGYQPHVTSGFFPLSRRGFLLPNHL